ncbi:MAG TPA: exosortase H [Chitinophagaceae bacterium]|nr:exosortase H [Chitinophagaceae bacterium]HNF71533.1 exosortase H [Chitinophagaceae bacterium]
MKKQKQEPVTASPTKHIPGTKLLLRFLILFAVLYIGFELAYFNDFLYQHVFYPVNKGFAWLSAKLLTVCGLPAHSNADSILNDTFSITVKQGCDSLEALAIFLCGVIAFPARMKIKLWGLLIGTSIILFMNLIRLMSLFWIGLYHFDLFDLFHLEIWQGYFIVQSIALWVIWVIQASKPVKTA